MAQVYIEIACYNTHTKKWCSYDKACLIEVEFLS